MLAGTFVLPGSARGLMLALISKLRKDICLSLSWDPNICTLANYPAVRLAACDSADHACMQRDAEGGAEAAWHSQEQPPHPDHSAWQALIQTFKGFPSSLGVGNRHGPWAVGLVIAGLVLLSLAVSMISHPVILGMRNSAGTGSVFGPPPR